MMSTDTDAITVYLSEDGRPVVVTRQESDRVLVLDLEPIAAVQLPPAMRERLLGYGRLSIAIPPDWRKQLSPRPRRYPPSKSWAGDPLAPFTPIERCDLQVRQRHPELVVVSDDPHAVLALAKRFPAP
jgi:hypothetical protein